MRCFSCRQNLTLQQPDLDRPERLLGVCATCRRWHLVLMRGDLCSAVMVAIPEDADFRAAWGAAGGGT